MELRFLMWLVHLPVLWNDFKDLPQEEVRGRAVIHFVNTKSSRQIHNPLSLLRSSSVLYLSPNLTGNSKNINVLQFEAKVDIVEMVMMSRWGETLI